MIDNTLEFYKALFDKDDYTCFTDSTNGRSVTHAIRNGIKKDLQYFSINPMHKGTTRSKMNVSSYRSILVEIDKDASGTPIPRKEQKKMFAKLGVPYTTLLWSGGKSLHGIITLAEPFKDIAEYEQAVSAVWRVLAKNGFPHDTGVRDAGRLSRCAGSIRINTKQYQEVEKVNSRITREEFDNWLAIYDEEVLAPEYHQSNMTYTGTSEASVELKVKWIKDYFMKDDEYVQGNRHHYQVKMAYLLLRTGLSANDIDVYFKTEFGEVSTGIGSCNTLSIEGLGESIYVPTMEERRAYMKSLEEQEQTELMSEETINFLTNRDEIVGGEALNHYVLVDNDFYWVDPQTNERRKRTSTAIRARFPNHSIHQFVPSERHYKGFKYLPNYVDFQRDLNGYYNTFEWFNFQPTPGEWKDIEIHFRHIFKEQYPQFIEWLRVALVHPTHPLWAIVLTSKAHGVGKNILAIIMKLIFGPNYSAIRRVDVEEARFNSAFAETQLCFIDEFEKVKDPVRAYGTFKEMITATEGIRVEKKGVDSYEVPFFSKFLFAHNASQVGFPGIEANDRRMWIVEVDKPDFVMNDAYVERIRAQVPHLVYSLMHEITPMYETSQNALWLTPEDTWTIWLDNAKENNRSYFYHKLKSEFEHYFEDHDEDIIYTTARSLGIRLNTDEYRKISFCLKDEFGAHQDDKVTRRTNALSGEAPKNGTKWFHITREMIYGKADKPVNNGDMGTNYFE